MNNYLNNYFIPTMKKDSKEIQLVKFWNYLERKLKKLNDNNKTAKEIFNKATGMEICTLPDFK